MIYKLILHILIIVSCVYGKPGFGQIRKTSDLNRINGILSKDKILFTADSDGSSHVHLVYIIEDNAFFLKFRPQQSSGSSPVKLPGAPGDSPYKRFFLFTKGQNDYFFWWNKGLNRLILDSSKKALKTSYAKALPSIPLADFKLTYAADKLWLSYSDHNGIFLRTSSDMGQNWSDIIPAYSFLDGESLTSVPEISIQKDNTYLTFSVLCKKTPPDGRTKSIPKIIIMTGNNEGKNWAQPSVVETVRRNSMVFQYPQIICRQNQLHLFYNERGIKYRHSIQNPLGFSLPTDITNTSSSCLKAQAFKDGFLLLWIDARYRQKEWWSYIPLHQMFTWDKDPYGANNDLFLMYYSEKAAKEFILSHQNSYTVPSQNSVKLLESNSNIIILWSGLSKIGKTLKDSLVPYSIYYRALPKSEFPGK